MAAKINSLIMQNRMLSQARSGLRTKNTNVGKVLNKNGKTTLADKVKAQAGKKNKTGRADADSLENYTAMKRAGSSLKEYAGQMLSLSKGMPAEPSKEEAEDYREKMLARAQGLVKDYNTLVKAMEEEGGTVNQIYLKQLRGYVKDARKDLEKVGITEDKNGALSINQETMKTADLEELKRILGSEGCFVDQVRARTENILSNAETNLAYINKNAHAGNYSYNQYGNDIFDVLSGGKYSAKG